MGRFPLPLSLEGTLIGLSRLSPSFLRRSGEIVREWLSRDLLLGSARAVDWHSSGSEAILHAVSALLCCLIAVPTICLNKSRLILSSFSLRISAALNILSFGVGSTLQLDGPSKSNFRGLISLRNSSGFSSAYLTCVSYFFCRASAIANFSSYDFLSRRVSLYSLSAASCVLIHPGIQIM